MPEILVDVPDFRPVVVYRNGDEHDWPTEAAQEAIAATLAHGVPQDIDPTVENLTPPDPYLRATFPHLFDTPIEDSVRWEVPGSHMAWTHPIAEAHGDRFGITPRAPVRGILPFGMNRISPDGVNEVRRHTDADKGRSNAYKIDQVAVMAQPAVRGGVLTFEPPDHEPVPLELDVGDLVMFDATMVHFVTEVLEGTRYTITSSTCREKRPVRRTSTGQAAGTVA